MDISGRRHGKQPTDPPNALGAVLTRRKQSARLGNREKQEQEIDHPPDRESEPRRGEKVGNTVGDRAGEPTVVPMVDASVFATMTARNERMLTI
jgi:hypothetical protein